MFKTLRISLVLLAAAMVMALGACAGLPNASQVIAIESACAIDAGIRPTVSVLLTLATPAEVATIDAARAVIDPVCANPGGSVQANTVAALTAASAQVLGVVTTLQARKAHPAASGA